MGLFSRKDKGELATATISHVEMLQRLSYGEAQVRVSYSVTPTAEPSFEATREFKVLMKHLPQAGQQVQVSYDPSDHGKLDVVTPPGEETGTPTTPTVEIGWAESDRSSYIRPNGTRGYR